MASLSHNTLVIHRRGMTSLGGIPRASFWAHIRSALPTASMADQVWVCVKAVDVFRHFYYISDIIPPTTSWKYLQQRLEGTLYRISVMYHRVLQQLCWSNFGEYFEDIESFVDIQYGAEFEWPGDRLETCNKILRYSFHIIRKKLQPSDSLWYMELLGDNNFLQKTILWNLWWHNSTIFQKLGVCCIHRHQHVFSIHINLLCLP